LTFTIILEVPTNVFGELLQKQVEDRLKFYDSGTLPPKNVEVMSQAVLKAEEAKNEILKKEKKKKKKEKKNKKSLENGDANVSNGNANGSAVEEHLEEMAIDDEETAADEQPKKKKKKKSKQQDE
jgi:nucleolar protein 56